MPAGLLLLAAWAACLVEVSRAHVQGSPLAPLSPERVYTSAVPGASPGQMVILAPNTAVHGTPLPPPPGAAPLGRVATPEACGAECAARGRACGWFLFCPAQGGCPDPGDGPPLAFQECRLLAANCSLLPEVHATGSPVQAISGFLARTAPAVITGFAESPGQGIGGSDYECPRSELPGRCAFNSTLDATVLCIDMPQCRAVTVLLNGTDGCSPPLAILKSEGLSPATAFVAPAVTTLQQSEAIPLESLRLYDREGEVLLPAEADVAELAASSAGASVADGNRWLGCFLGSALFGGEVLAVESGVESAEACCRRCRQLAPATTAPTPAPPPGGGGAAAAPLPPAAPACNAWNYCPTDAPCSFQATQGSRELVQLAPRQCQLRYQELSAPTIGWPLAVLAKGAAAGPFLGGAPIVVWGPELPGYQRLIGRGLFTHGRYNCTGSLRPIVQECVRPGTVQQLASQCSSDPWCKAFIMKPGGLLESVPGVGIFKQDADPAAILFNPTGILYIQDQDSGGLAAGAIAGIAVGSAAAAVLLGTGAWLAMRRRRQRRRELLSAGPKDTSHALELGGAMGSGSDGKQPAPLLPPRWEDCKQDSGEVLVSPFTAAAAARAFSEGGSSTALEPSVTPQRLSADAGVGGRPPLPPAGALALARAGSAPPPRQPPLWDRGPGSRPPLPRAARAGSDPARAGSGATAVVPAAAGDGASAGAPSTPARSAGQGTWGNGLSPASTATLERSSLLGRLTQQQQQQQRRQGSSGAAAFRTPASAHPLSRSSTLERAGTLPGLSMGAEAGYGAAAGHQQGGAVLPELVQHVAEQEADASGGAAGGVGHEPDEGEHALVRAETLPARLRPWVVDPSAVQYMRLPSGKVHELGSGASARVYKAMLNGEVVAAKEILIGQSRQLQEAFLTEAVNLQRLRHPCVVAFHGLSLTPTKGVVLMELCEGRDLHSALQLTAAGSSQRLFSWYRRGRRVAHDVARALNYLHSRGVVHMDIKSSNVLLTATGSAKLADVAFSRLQTGAYLSDLPLVGTFAWVAPEILLGGQGCTSAVDLFSVGVLLWEIVTGERPQRGHLRPPRVPLECSQEVADLIAACLREYPAERPTAQQLLQQLSRLMEGAGRSSGSSYAPPGDASRRGGAMPAAASAAALETAAAGSHGLAGT